MTAAQWEQLKSILADALEQQEGHRQRFVEDNCGLRVDLAAEALAFLRYAEETADGKWLGGQFALFDSRVPGIAPDGPSGRPLFFGDCGHAFSTRGEG